jgi:hypothetical protein
MRDERESGAGGYRPLTTDSRLQPIPTTAHALELLLLRQRCLDGRRRHWRPSCSSTSERTSIVRSPQDGREGHAQSFGGSPRAGAEGSTGGAAGPALPGRVKACVGWSRIPRTSGFERSPVSSTPRTPAAAGVLVFRGSIGAWGFGYASRETAQTCQNREKTPSPSHLGSPADHRRGQISSLGEHSTDEVGEPASTVVHELPHHRLEQAGQRRAHEQRERVEGDHLRSSAGWSACSSGTPFRTAARGSAPRARSRRTGSRRWPVRASQGPTVPRPRG